MDPLTTIVGTAAITKVVDKVFDGALAPAGRKLAARWEERKAKALAKAQENQDSFAEKLRGMVAIMETEGKLPIDVVERAIEGPDFLILLRQALLAAAQTESEEKHDLLARLLAERLAAEPEGLLAVVSKRAVDTISCLSPRHLKILGLMASVQVVGPDGDPLEDMPPEEAKERLLEHLTTRWAGYRNLECGPMDFLHLLTESCIVDNSRTVPSLALWMNETWAPITLTDPDLEHNPGTAHVFRLWRNEGSLRFTLTTTRRKIAEIPPPPSNIRVSLFLRRA